MTLIKELKNLIELFDNNILSEDQVELLIQQKVSTFKTSNQSGNIDSYNYLSNPDKDSIPTNKQWMSQLIDVISSSSNFDLIIDKLKDASFCEFKFKTITGMPVFIDYLEGSKCPVSEGTSFKRYYSKPIYIKEKKYWVYSQWYNGTGLNNRPLLDLWTKENM